jgi:hypothetical protein
MYTNQKNYYLLYVLICTCMIDVVLSNESIKNVFSKFPLGQFKVNISTIWPIIELTTSMDKSMFHFLLKEELS